MNNCSFIGRVGADAEVRHMQDGDAVTNWRIAVDAGYGAKKKTVWINCTMWGKRGESVAPYIKKGDRIGVHGEISTREYEGKNGKGFSVDLRVNDVILLGTKSESQPPQPAVQPADEFEDTLPF